MATSDLEILQYIPLQSFVNATFWHKLAEVKIDIDKLSDAPKEIFGYYTNNESVASLLEVDYSAFNSNFSPPKFALTSYGVLYNKNTVEDFKNCDKLSLISHEGRKIIQDIESGTVLEDPRLLSRFFILSFADLKVHKFYYWFAFPAPLNPTAYIPKGSQPKKLRDVPLINSHLPEIYNSLKNDISKAYFILKHDNENRVKYFHLKDLIKLEDRHNNFIDQDLNQIYFCFSDPCEYDKPSWLLRLYITCLYILCPFLREKDLQFIGVRLKSANNFESSLLWTLKILDNDEDLLKQFVGWEINQNGKMVPKLASMSESMDPTKLADNSVNLNLKLMKWRLLPDLNLNVINCTKCLLLGAGTLGCAVTRNLLGWGFKTVSFVDNGRVSLSNPVRQSLYRYEDAISGKEMKATTAAKRVKEINPNTTTAGYVIQIPMPGHPVGDSMHENVLKDLNNLEELVKTHDVIFLLTDSRESRWLPTLLGAFYEKIVINAALGFDSYLVMRHGSNRKLDCVQRTENIGNLKCILGGDLGCYFCNDITAPGDSMRDRTLDQQCTVTRPGVSNIAASYAVELLVALLQHNERDLAPAYFSTSLQNDTNLPEGLLGVIPHSIRGSIVTYENILPATSKFSQCIACSEKVLNEFRLRRNEFLLEVFSSAKYLEDLTGISELVNYEDEIIELEESDVERSN